MAFVQIAPNVRIIIKKEGFLALSRIFMLINDRGRARLSLSRIVRVGLAEDNLDFCQVLCEFLNNDQGLEVVGMAYDGVNAIEMVKTVSMDVLLLDMIMPKLDGIGVLEYLREIEKRPKVVVFSAFGHEEMTKKAVDLGADYFVVKPFNLEVLAKRIKEISIQPVIKSFTTLRVENQDAEIEKEVSEILHKLQIPTHFKGYTYLRRAIVLCVQEPALINEVTRGLYPKVAEEYDSTKYRVERAMRFAIETAWNKGEVDYLHQLMGYTVDEKKGKPTNLSFIAKIADQIRLEKNLRA